jgi:hypothetical protein
MLSEFLPSRFSTLKFQDKSSYQTDQDEAGLDRVNQDDL